MDKKRSGEESGLNSEDNDGELLDNEGRIISDLDNALRKHTLKACLILKYGKTDSVRSPKTAAAKKSTTIKETIIAKAMMKVVPVIVKVMMEMLM